MNFNMRNNIFDLFKIIYIYIYTRFYMHGAAKWSIANNFKVEEVVEFIFRASRHVYNVYNILYYTVYTLCKYVSYNFSY